MAPDGSLIRPGLFLFETMRSGKDITMTTQTAAGLVAAAKARIENLTPDEVEQELANGAVLVDIREPEERVANGAIEGNIHAARGMLEFYADPTSAYHREEFDPEKRVILYCASGGRSALAVEALQALGYRNIAHLDTGVKGWIEAGKAVHHG
jgi:rhodanese-related sulfurtransferase